jgi:hypothetical protein
VFCGLALVWANIALPDHGAAGAGVNGEVLRFAAGGPSVAPCSSPTSPRTMRQP